MDRELLDISNYKRVLRLAIKPDKQEFRKVALITGGGAALIGILGTVVFLIMNLPA